MESHDTSSVAHSRWPGFLAGTVAAGAALGFGELIEGATDDIPSLVVAVGELIVDYTPGDAVATSIETLGSNQKGVLLTGITVVSLLLGGVLGDLSNRRGRKIGLLGFGLFGLIGGWTAARNPLSPAFGSWITALAAAAIGAGVLIFLLNRLHQPARQDSTLEDPTDPRATRRQTGGHGEAEAGGRGEEGPRGGRATGAA